MSPEQEKVGKYDSKTDLYSLGIIIFELFYDVNSNHERIKLIQNLRGIETVFPLDFEESLVQKYFQTFE